SAGEEVLREGEAEVVLVLGTEAEASERGKRVVAEGAARRVLESRQPLVGRGGGTKEILIARSRWRRRFSRVDRRPTTGGRELRGKGAGVARRSTELREAEAACLVLLAVGAVHPCAGDADHFAFRFSDAYGFVERDRARPARRAYRRQCGRGRGRARHLRAYYRRNEHRHDGNVEFQESAEPKGAALECCGRHCSG